MGSKQDLTGKIFGRLTAIEPIYENNIRKWKCACICGNVIIVSTSQLNAGNKSSCGCIHEDYKTSLINKRYGNLIVIAFEGYGITSRPLWLCRCDCGKDVVVSSKNLNRKSTTHCGCKRKENISKAVRKEYGESTKHSLILAYKGNARAKNLIFELTDNKCIELFEDNCYYCGKPPSNIINRKNMYGEYTYNGIDRLDSKLGYVEGNVVTCCQCCNYMKNKYTEKEFLDIIRKIAIHKKLVI